MDDESTPPNGTPAPAPTPAPSPAEKPAPTSQTPTPTIDGEVRLTAAEYRTLRADRERKIELERARDAEVERLDSEKLKAMTEAGQYQDALKEHQSKSKKEFDKIAAERDAVQRRYLERERSIAVNEATAGVNFLSEFAAKQARQILESRFETVVDAQTSEVQVVDRVTRRPAADVAKDWLASVEAAHFLAPKGKGGSPTQQGNPQADAPTEPEPTNLSFEQRVMIDWQKQQQAQAANGWQLPITTQSRIRAGQK